MSTIVMILKHLRVISIVGWLSPLGVIHNDLHPPPEKKNYNMVLKITKVKKETQIWTRPPIFWFQGWINDESTYGECPVWVDESVSRYWSSWVTSRKPFQWWVPLASIRCAKSIKVILGAKKMLREKMGGVELFMMIWFFFMGFKWIQEDLGKMSPIKLSNLFTVFKPSLNSLSMGGAAHIHGICSVSWPKVFGVLWIFDWFFWGKLQSPANCKLSPTSRHFGVDNLFLYGGIWHRDSLQGLPDREIQLRTNGLVPQVTIPFLTLRWTNIAGWKMEPDWRCIPYRKWGIF